MNKLIVVLAVAVAMLAAGNVWALVLGDNITIPDKSSSAPSGWYGPQEDQEVEPNCVTDQKWDLEGFFLKNGSTLTMVGGYDMVNGAEGWMTGDVFIDTDGNVNYGIDNYAVAGDAVRTVNNSLFGYEYVLDLDMATRTYDVYALDNDTLLSIYYRQNDESNPWRYSAGGTLVEGWSDVPFSYYTGLTSADVANLVGASHNAAVFSLAFLPAGTEFISHYTYQCGNDNLMGRATVPDGAVTAILLGFALLGIEGLRRKLAR